MERTWSFTEVGPAPPLVNPVILRVLRDLRGRSKKKYGCGRAQRGRAGGFAYFAVEFFPVTRAVGTAGQEQHGLKGTPNAMHRVWEPKPILHDFWPNRIIGDQFLPPEKRLTRTTITKLTKDPPLIESGLLGPVTLGSP